MARVTSTAWSWRTKTSMSEAIRSPSDSPPPTSRLKPRVPSSARAGHRPMSLISAWAQSSTHPVTEILNLRGRLAYSRLPVKKSETARATGRASKASWASTPDTGQLSTLRAESPQACTVVRPDGGEPPPDAGDVLDAQPVDLDGLAGGEVGVAGAEHPALGAVGALAEGVGHHADLTDLRRGEEATGDLDPHHEGVAALLLRDRCRPT